MLAYAEDGFSVFLPCTQSCRSSGQFRPSSRGRCLEFEIFPLDFREYLGMKEHLHAGALGSLDDEFRSYLQDGGFPKALELSNSDERRECVRGIASQILKRDVRARRRISTLKAFVEVQSCLLSHCASPFSTQGLLKRLADEGIRAKAQTVRGYVLDLKEAGIIHECRRFGLKRNRAIARSLKYCPADLSLCLLEGPGLCLDRTQALVYLYLEGSGYEVSI